MSDESRALDILQAQVDSLKEQLKDAFKERDEYRDATVELSNERDELKGSVGKETDTLDQAPGPHRRAGGHSARAGAPRQVHRAGQGREREARCGQASLGDRQIQTR